MTKSAELPFVKVELDGEDTKVSFGGGLDEDTLIRMLHDVQRTINQLKPNREDRRLLSLAARRAETKKRLTRVDL